jgi:4-amino-4-deoxy-L-arabinose transferase-like glycosyltransferase
MGRVRKVWRGRRGRFWQGLVWWGAAGKARLVLLRSGQFGCGRVWRGRRGIAVQGAGGAASLCLARMGRQGAARPVVARPGGQGGEWQARCSEAFQG